VSIRKDGRVYVAPSGVQEERIAEPDLYVFDESGTILEAPSTPGCAPSACAPLFFNAFRLRDAGAVIHSDALEAMLVTLLCNETLACTHLEMIKLAAERPRSAPIHSRGTTVHRRLCSSSCCSLCSPPS
jgi:ribulose-5-phosphate 4-epimerase/fuculose-1-phosphate aldolase